MSGRKNMLVTFGLILSVSLIASAFAAMVVSRHYGRTQFDLLNAVCGEILGQGPEAKIIVSAALKEYTDQNMEQNADQNMNETEIQDVLPSLGYHFYDFMAPDHVPVILSAAAGFLIGFFLFLFTFLYRNKMETKRIQTLADYLEQVNTKNAAVLSAVGEDDFSKLEDEIYKTVTFLYHTKNAAVQAKKDFAENLSNIAHQIKTPITAISLSVQTMQNEYDEKKAKQIQKQLLRLTRLEEALLVLSRLDAGTLRFQKEETDVFTLLVLTADNLQELFAESGTSADIPELGEMAVTIDLDWTMEAVINLMKNCMEHNRGGTIHCSYEQNPLYTEILIWDEGEGFCKEDIPHLFERFYRGKNACEGGIGIGLSLSKEIIERQNGTIRAKNRLEGGACFEIRFYCH